MITLDGLQHRFGEFTLGPVSLDIGAGEYWVLLGPSGSGKSLLLQVLAGLVLPEQGRVCRDGQDMTRTAPEARGVGLVFQESALFPHLSVADNIGYGLRARGTAKALRERRIAEVVSQVGLAPIMNRPTATLSGGEAQKVAIARALAISPKILLLDEPLGPIDFNGRVALQQELKRLHRTLGLTTLHVTHSREEAQAVADCCAVMLAGRVIQRGRAEPVFAQPRCAFVAQFLGASGVDSAAWPACDRACLLPGGHCTQEDEA
jgi:ABC-type Fe3+/spermidine/putrescine transport system ATPase subunit